MKLEEFYEKTVRARIWGRDKEFIQKATRGGVRPLDALLLLQHKDLSNNNWVVKLASQLLAVVKSSNLEEYGKVYQLVAHSGYYGEYDRARGLFPWITRPSHTIANDALVCDALSYQEATLGWVGTMHDLQRHTQGDGVETKDQGDCSRFLAVFDTLLAGPHTRQQLCTLYGESVFMTIAQFEERGLLLPRGSTAPFQLNVDECYRRLYNTKE